MEIVTKNPDLAVLAERILRGLATERDFKSANPEDVYAIKSDTGTIHYRAVPGRPKEADQRGIKYVASEESQDRMGDVIVVSGWDFKDFKANAVALWAHDDKILPIGRVDGIKRSGAQLFETIHYAEAEINPFADALYKLDLSGAPAAVSVGFLPVEVKVPESPEERQKMGLGPWGVRYVKQAQLELSRVNIPAHQNALAVRTLDGLVDQGQISAGQAADFLKAIAAPRKVFAVGGLVEPEEPEGASEVGTQTEEPTSAPAIEDKSVAPPWAADLQEIKSLIAEQSAALNAIQELRDTLKAISTELAAARVVIDALPKAAPTEGHDLRAADVGQTRSQNSKEFYGQLFSLVAEKLSK